MVSFCHYDSGMVAPKMSISRFISGIRVGQNLTGTAAFQKLDTEAINRVHPECKELTFDSDAYMECYIRHNTLPMWNYVGSCKMGATGDTTAVVDPSLKYNNMKYTTR